MQGIIDEPLPIIGGIDTLGIQKYVDVLSKFVKTTDTPMTIGIQGEWGSGKTSALNSIWNQLEEDPKTFKIWVNTWEHSLLCDPEEALVKLVLYISSQIALADASKENQEKIKKAALGLAKNALRVTSALTMGAGAATLFDKNFETEGNSIREVRLALAHSIEELANRPSNPYERFVVFVDDLDRLEPAYAVRILELLKNIFNIKRCVFILAIDYQVVVKGLKQKFGELNENNEWEFRAFFDKIIQLPFMMPMGDYKVGEYIHDLLIKTKFDTNRQLNQETLSDFILISIGANPRSIKRLVNSLSLISMMTESLVTEKIDKTVLFAAICLQITYPKIYEVLKYEPDFTSLTSAAAYEFTNGKEEHSEEFKNLLDLMINNEILTEEWEQSIYRICYCYPFMRTRALDVLKFLYNLKDFIESNNQNLANCISKAITRSSVTMVSETDGRKTIRSNEDIGDVVSEHNFLLRNIEYRIVLRDSGQVQAFEVMDNKKVTAKKVLIEYINEKSLPIDYINLSTRVIGKKVFDYIHKK